MDANAVPVPIVEVTCSNGEYPMVEPLSDKVSVGGVEFGESMERMHSNTTVSSPTEQAPRQIFPPSISLLPKQASLLVSGIRRPSFVPSIDFPNQGRGCMSEFDLKPPVWAYQPLKALYTVYFILITALIYLPFQAIVQMFRSNRGNPDWSWKRSMMVSFFRSCIVYICNTRVILTKQPPTTPPKLEKSEFVWLEPKDHINVGVAAHPSKECSDIRGELLRAMRLQGVSSKRISGYWFSTPGTHITISTPPRENEFVLYHLHGGAYWMGTSHENSQTAAMDMGILQRIAKDESAKVLLQRAFTLEYRLANHTDHTHGSYPAALVDALVGYLYLTRTCGFAPKNVIFTGDSSGGNLALALCRYLRDEKVAPMPGFLLLISPWCDVSRSHSGPLHAPNSFSSTVMNKASDIIDSSSKYRNTAVSALLGALPAREAYLNPYISPVSLHLDSEHGAKPPFWGFLGFPEHVYILTGNSELNTEQHVTLAHRMAQGTHRGRPEYTGDRTSEGGDLHEYTWRDNFPRSHHALNRQTLNEVQGYDNPALEDRDVALDECKTGIHVFPLFSWFEPERGQALDRIVQWIEQKAFPSS
ncbi:hypothetical protein MVES1_002965 [Malassezia vespertilionis]|uniref:Alpha/beta hydrolase fold-3 domain-containing protein n=1 Tax=Malassezia vespertilionis TaxID=2020962 RepID=A0A2N1J8V4_9BASI|nr:uncharacterized protein MVES1_002965 [Malassezia vespertilionis]PKI82966.1 hypothetical protein MVES_002814 [Malassezia vespertilionis]WFD07598.1 hypothetical protein MVES1_002965 [Malassezia vespertilionis]